MNQWTKLEEVLAYYIELIDDLHYEGNPKELYEPISYFMQIGGKRLRPALVGLGAHLFSDSPQTADAIAKTIEIFHNFTLVHDDIMDKAPLRRGKSTVHEKWNTNIAILSGDVMLVRAYQELSKGNYPNLQDLITLFNQTAIEVCEGQQLDMNFEKITQVSIPEYIQMIKLKTSVLLGCALKMGAMSVGANNKDSDALYQFGVNMGIAFQLMDDYLDAFGDPEKFGKQVGGDILSNKKTFLSIQALEKDTTGDIQLWFAKNEFDPKEKITTVKNIYTTLGVDEACKKEMNYYHQKALKSLTEITVEASKKQLLFDFSHWLMHREL